MSYPVLLKSILNKIISLSLVLCTLCGSSYARTDYGFQNPFAGSEPAQLDSVISSISAHHHKKPADPAMITQLAEAYMVKGQTDSALAYWQLLSHMQPGNDTAYYAQAQIYYDAGHPDSASVLIRQALLFQPECIPYLSLLAISDYRMKDADSAFFICEKVLAISPSDANALLLSGIILRDRKKNDAALERFDRCLSADAGNTAALIHRADEFVLLKKYNDALRDYSAARGDLSTDPDILNNIGICYYQSGAYRQAIGLFRKAIAIDHIHPQSYFNKGLSYYRLSEPDTASLDMKKASAIWDTCTTDSCHSCRLDAIYYLGMCYKQTGDLPAARSQFALLQHEKYPLDLSSEIWQIDCALFISQNWYYFILLLLLTITLIAMIIRIMRRQ